MPYKLVMGKLTKPPTISGINTPGRVKTIVRELFPTHQKRPKDDWPTSSTQKANNAPTQLEEIKTAARSLRSNTVPGPDGITNDVLKCYILCKPDLLSKIYKKCLSEGHFPMTWKSGRLILLKKGDKLLDQPTSYRPLCILDCPVKLLKKIIDHRLRNFLEVNNGLDERQFGFRKGRSTTNAIHTLRSIVEDNSPRKKIRVLTLDTRNAFNSAPWETILKALLEKSIPSYLCRIIGSYLDNRSLLYRTDDKQIAQPISSGVPQGSVLGTTLWNTLYDGILKNRLPAGVSFLAFADDVALVAVAKDTILLGNALSETAETTRNWLLDVGMHLAIQKSEALVITNTRIYNDMTVHVGRQ